jgi:uncharacterized protein YodC (DUF2158 family)
MADFKIGDKVKLNTGQKDLPVMVVVTVTSLGIFSSECRWYDAATNKFNKDIFPHAALVKVE